MLIRQILYISDMLGREEGAKRKSQKKANQPPMSGRDGKLRCY